MMMAREERTAGSNVPRDKSSPPTFAYFGLACVLRPPKTQMMKQADEEGEIEGAAPSEIYIYTLFKST
jgi:hypothetical protein